MNSFGVKHAYLVRSAFRRFRYARIATITLQVLLCAALLIIANT